MPDTTDGYDLFDALVELHRAKNFGEALMCMADSNNLHSGALAAVAHAALQHIEGALKLLDEMRRGATT